MVLRKGRTDTFLITVFVKPRSNKNSIEIIDENIIMRIKSAPIKGKANKEVIKQLSKLFKTKQTNIIILSGHTSTTKIIGIQNLKEDHLLKTIQNIK